jgi:hypothetical protein
LCLLFIPRRCRRASQTKPVVCARPWRARAALFAAGELVSRPALARSAGSFWRLRAAFSFVHFFWPRKRNGPRGSRGGAPAFFYIVPTKSARPYKSNPRRSRPTIRFPTIPKNHLPRRIAQLERGVPPAPLRAQRYVNGDAHLPATREPLAIAREESRGKIKSGLRNRNPLICVVPRVGLEPTQCRHYQILSLARLPVPPPRQKDCQYSNAHCIITTQPTDI